MTLFTLSGKRLIAAASALITQDQTGTHLWKCSGTFGSAAARRG